MESVMLSIRVELDLSAYTLLVIIKAALAVAIVLAAS